MTVTRLFVGFVAGVALAGLMLLVGGIAFSDSPAKCPGCAVLNQPTHACHEAVQGGYICP